MTPTDVKTPTRRRRRWLRRLLIAGACLAGLLGIAVFAAGPLAKRAFVGRLEGDYRVRASVDELSLGTRGVEMRRLAVVDLAGDPLVALDRFQLELAPLEALRGRWNLDVELSGFELHLRRGDDGTWNVQGLERDEPKAGTPSGDERGPSSEPGPLPVVAARVHLSDVRVVVHGEGGATELALTELDVRLDDLETPAHIAGRGFLSGLGEGGGALEFAGDVTPAHAGELAPSGAIRLQVEEVLLHGLVPLIAELTPLADLGGMLSGQIELALEPGGVPTGDVDLTAADVSFVDPDGRQARVPQLALRGSGKAFGEPGSGQASDDDAVAQRLTLVAGDAFELSWSGSVRRANGASGIQGALELTSELSEVAELARDFVPALTERAVGGRLALHSGVQLDLDTLEATFDASVVVANARANGAQGNALPLELLEGARLTLRGRADADEVEVSTVAFDGPFRATGSVAPYRFADASAALEAKLEIGAAFAWIEQQLETELGLGGDVQVRAELRRTPDGVLAIGGLELDSELCRARLGGEVRLVGDDVVVDALAGELRYSPERLQAAFGESLPGAFVGDAEGTLAVDWTATLASFDARSVLDASRLDATLTLVPFESAGLVLAGPVEVDILDGALALRADLSANGGKLVATGALPRDGAAPFTLDVRAEDVGANSEVTELFAFLHPAFAEVRELEGEVGGRIDAELAATCDAGLVWEALLTSREAFPTDKIAGSGSLGIRNIVITESPLLERLREELDDDPSSELRMRPVRFALDGGRVRYVDPWTWTLAGTETTFEGSVGLDESLDLVWTVPVTPGLAKRYRVLESFVGETLEVPLRGTASEPELEWSGLLKELAGRTLGRSLGLGAKEDPADLLARADRLWSEGKHAEAAELYHRIREEHKLSLVYTLNRSRIKDREKARE